MRVKTKILFILPGFTYGGTVFSTLNMISLLSKNKYDIFIMSMSHQGIVKELYSPYHILDENIFISACMGKVDKEVSYFRKLLFLGIKVLNKCFSKFGFNLLFSEYKKASCFLQNKYCFDIVASCQEGQATFFASFFSKAKRIAWFRSEYKYYLERITSKTVLQEQDMYKLFESIVCVSNATKNDFACYFPFLKDKLCAIHNIQNVEDIIAKSKKEIDDEKFDNSEFTIVSIGRIDPQKRFSSIPIIASILKQKKIRFKWYIIGEGNFYNENDKLQRNIKEYCLDDEVICLGSKINPYPYIAKSNLLVNVSYVEACPRVVIEAKILCVPVICADFTSAREFVNDNFDGFVNGIDLIHESISKLILEPEEYCRIKMNCRMFNMNNSEILRQLDQVFSI